MLGRTLVQAASGTAAEADTGWDIANIAFEGSPVNAYNTNADGLTYARGIFIGNSGTKFYAASVGVSGHGLDSFVSGYTLSTAYDISTASLDYQYNINNFEGGVEDIFFKPDGTKMFTVGYSGDEINEFDLTTAWDLSTASASETFDISSEDTSPSGFTFKTDGTVMYVSGTSNDKIFQYTLSTAWDITTASYANKSFSYTSQMTNAGSVAFKSDGTKMFLHRIDDMYEYTLSTAWDVSTASFSQSETNFTQPHGGSSSYAVWKDDGTKFWYHDSNKGVIFQRTFTTAWDVSTVEDIPAYTSKFFAMPSGTDNPQGLFFKSDGSKMYVLDATDDDVSEFDLSTDWDIDTASFNQKYSFASVTGVSYGLHFKSDGTKMYILSLDNDRVYQFALSTAWDVSTASSDGSKLLSGENLYLRYMTFKPDGTKMYITGAQGDEINEYDLSTAWDVTTATHNDVKSEYYLEGSPAFKPDGLKLITVMGIGSGRNLIQEYPLTTAWDVTTIGSKTQSQVLNAFTADAGDIYIHEDGDKLFVVDNDLKGVISFSM